MDDHIPGWIDSPRCLKSHMTAPQDMAAKTENTRAFGGMGRATAPAAAGGVGAERGMNEARTREQT
jgi:hypothetical protein